MAKLNKAVLAHLLRLHRICRLVLVGLGGEVPLELGQLACEDGLWTALAETAGWLPSHVQCLGKSKINSN